MLEFLTQSTWTDRIGWVLVHSFWQFALVALAAIVLQRVLRRRPATTRYRALLAVMAIMVAVPVATWYSPWSGDAPVAANHIGWAPPTDTFVQEAGSARPTTTTMAVLPAEIVAKPQAEPLRSEPAAIDLAFWWSIIKARVQPWLPEIVLVWLAGVMVVAMRPLLSWRTVRRLRSVGVEPVAAEVHGVLERTAKRLRLARAVEMLQSTLVKTPVVVGYFRPVVLLPLCVVSGLPAVQLESILAHELAHICRHDYLVNLLQTLVETLFFYHPAVWWLSRQIRNERENCCDDLAMAAVGSRADYGRALLAIEELRAASPALSLAARGGSLLARIRRIAGCEPAPSVVGGSSVLGAILVSLAVIGGGLWGAAWAADKSAADTGTDPKTSSLDPVALLQAYEKTLVPYRCFKVTLIDRYASLEKDKEPQWIDRDDTWTLFRDGDRGKSMLTQKKTSEKGPTEQSWQEEVWEKGKSEVSVHPPHPRRGPGDFNAPIVISEFEVSEKDILKHVRFLPASYGVIADTSIPAFLQASKLSAERDTLEGREVNVLRGVSGEIEIKLWLDPALGHIPRKITYDNRTPTPDGAAIARVYEVKRFQQRDGVLVPVETLETDRWPARPAINYVVVEVVDGKRRSEEDSEEG